MNDLTIRKLQEYLKITYPYGPEKSSSLFMKLVEEIGEVAEALNEIDGRKAKSEETSLAKELVDVIHYAVAIASLNDIDLSKAIIDKDKTAAVKYGHSINLEEFLSGL